MSIPIERITEGVYDVICDGEYTCHPLGLRGVLCLVWRNKEYGGALWVQQIGKSGIPLAHAIDLGWQFTARYVRCEGEVECFGVQRESDGKFIAFGNRGSSRVVAASYPMPVKILRGVFIPLEQSPDREVSYYANPFLEVDALRAELAERETADEQRAALLHQAIMNLSPKAPDDTLSEMSYRLGFRDARRAAAELATTMLGVG